MTLIKRIRKAVARVAALRPIERVLVAQAAIALPVAALGTRTVGVRRVLAWLDRLDAHAPKGELEPARVVGLVRALARRSPYPMACLESSIVSCAVLRRKGYAATVCIGASRESGFAAHAWIEIDGSPIGESENVRERFASLLGGVPRADVDC